MDSGNDLLISLHSFSPFFRSLNHLKTTKLFKLDFDIPESPAKINLKDPVYLIGSCFSDSIGDRLRGDKFNCMSNPFGTIYNPISIFKLLRDELDAKNTIKSQGVLYHWDTHGRISGLNESELANTVEQTEKASSDFLANASHLIITLGSSLVYRLKTSKQVVANCHKVDSQQFSKEMLSVEEICEDWAKTYRALLKINPNLKVIFTVSPVRHVRDGLIDNNLSKAILLQAVHRIVADNNRTSYFPSYEIMLDELRDYRFFASDLVHPSEEAISYIWKQFGCSYFDSKTLEFKNEWAKLKSSVAHKPFQPNSAEHQKFLQNTIQKLEHLKSEIDVTDELESLKKQLI